MDAVEDREPLSPGGKHRQAERGDQRQAIAGDKGVQLLGQVREVPCTSASRLGLAALISRAASTPSGVSIMHHTTSYSGAPSRCAGEPVT